MTVQKQTFNAVRKFQKFDDGIKHKCPFCANDSVEYCSRYPSLDHFFVEMVVLFCSSCGGGYVPSAHSLINNYYASSYALNNRKDREIYPEQYFSSSNTDVKYRKYFQRAQAQVDILKKHGSDLDVGLDYGAGPGYLLWKSGAKEKWAVELDEHSYKYLKYLDVNLANIDELPRDYFSFIVSSHSIEHLCASDLYKTITSLVCCLKKGGVFLLEVPTGAHSYLELNTRQDPHTLFFTPEALLRLVQRIVDDYGLKIVSYFSRTKGEVPERANPIYYPDQNKDPFFAVRSGGLTVIVKRI